MCLVGLLACLACAACGRPADSQADGGQVNGSQVDGGQLDGGQVDGGQVDGGQPVELAGASAPVEEGASPVDGSQVGTGSTPSEDRTPGPSAPAVTRSPAGPPVVAPRPSSRTPAALLPAEAWDVYFIQDAKVGYAHFTSEPLEENGESLLRLTTRSELTLKRFGQTITQRLTLVSVETPDGVLRRCRSEILAGLVATVTEGRVENGELILEVTTLGTTQVSRLAWQPEWGGFFAGELSLLRKPMKAGETRTLTTLMPVFNQTAQVSLVAGPEEETPLLEGSQRLLRIATTARIGPNAIDSISWVNAQGETLKSLVPGLNQLAYRTTKEVALRAGGPANFDLGTASVVKVERPLPGAHQTQRVVYRATLPDIDPRTVFASEGGQQVRPLDDQTVEITVQAVRPGQPAKLDNPGNEPAAGDLEPNSLIQSDDPRVVAMAEQVAADETDPWKLACALEGHVRRVIRSKNFSQAFATAAEVAQSLEGDCTEHAVLLAALCRARKIPARVAIGLVYYAQAQGFAYHMWNEVWINDRWVPLDGTLGQGGTGAAHLKLVHSDLRGASAYSAFLPVFRVLGQLKLEVTSVEPASDDAK